jgi:hypothetical protein
VTPQQQTPPFDQGNSLIALAETPALLTASKITTPTGEMAVWTIRTPTTTLTLLFGGKTAKEWAAQLTGHAAGMSSAGLATGNGTAPK